MLKQDSRIAWYPSSSPSVFRLDSGLIMGEICRGDRLELDWPLAHGGVLANCVAMVTKVAPHRKRSFRLAFEDAV